LLLAAAGLALFALSPAGGGFAAHVLPGMVLLGSAPGWRSIRCCSPP